MLTVFLAYTDESSDVSASFRRGLVKGVIVTSVAFELFLSWKVWHELPDLNIASYLSKYNFHVPLYTDTYLLTELSPS
jgi:hypothetical protein